MTVTELKNEIAKIEKSQKENWAKFANIEEKRVLIVTNSDETRRIIYSVNTSYEVKYILNNITAFSSDMGVFDYGGKKVFTDTPVQYAIRSVGDTWNLYLKISYKLMSGDEINIEFNYNKMEQNTKDLFSITNRPLNDIEIPRFRGDGWSVNDIKNYKVRVLEFGNYETLRYYGGYRTLISSEKINEIITYFKNYNNENSN